MRHTQREFLVFALCIYAFAKELHLAEEVWVPDVYSWINQTFGWKWLLGNVEQVQTIDWTSQEQLHREMDFFLANFNKFEKLSVSLYCVTDVFFLHYQSTLTLSLWKVCTIWLKINWTFWLNVSHKWNHKSNCCVALMTRQQCNRFVNCALLAADKEWIRRISTQMHGTNVVIVLKDRFCHPFVCLQADCKS